MKNHGIVATDWQLKAAQEGQLEAIMLPVEPQPTYSEFIGAWLYKDSFLWDPITGQLNREILPYKIGDTIYFQEGWYPVEHTMPIEAAQHKFLVTDVCIQQMKDLFPTQITLRRKLGWLTTESNPKRIKQDWEKAWNTQFPDYPYHRNLFAIILSLEPKQC